jgi:hypothetical protein
MTKISPELLNDTLNLVQLAREMALARGKEAQAEKLTPVEENLRNIVSSARQPKAEPHAGLMAQRDFQTLLNAVQSRPQTTQAADQADRNQIVKSMSAAGMADLDVARQMGITRDEVRLILSTGQKQDGTFEGLK